NAPRRFFSGLAVGACAAGIWMALYPEVIRGPGGQIDPLVRAELSPRTMEFLPATVSFPVFILSNYMGLLGIAAISALFWRDRRSPTRFSWLMLAALLTLLIYLTIAHIRFAPYACVVAAFAIAALLEHLQEWLNAWQSCFAGYLRGAALLV